MRCLLDTNILISAALFPGSIPARAFEKAVSPPHSAVVCEYSVDEMRRVFNRKFPQRIADFERFFAMLALALPIVPTPMEAADDDTLVETLIRDVHDRPIFRAARAASVDSILTGDKDFLESGITRPRILTAAEFVALP